MEFDSDIQIHSTSNPEAERLPSNATASLSHISFNEPASKLILKGRFSASNFDKLVLSVRNATMIDLSFSMYAFDAFHQTWYNRLESTTGISGKIERMETIQKFGKDKDSFQEVMMEISPSLSNDKRYIKYMTSSDKESLREIKWSPTLKNECKPGLVVNRGRRYFNELFESAILL
ncbi:hypothetical protein BD560DRAFT_422471 [Blakeslea trispora]|nr:hypothetical protein BD560DRAFT_422471 [Blakeslea trispora]